MIAMTQNVLFSSYGQMEGGGKKATVLRTTTCLLSIQYYIFCDRARGHRVCRRPLNANTRAQSQAILHGMFGK
jgi:hypothetical protein